MVGFQDAYTRLDRVPMAPREPTCPKLFSWRMNKKDPEWPWPQLMPRENVSTDVQPHPSWRRWDKRYPTIDVWLREQGLPPSTNAFNQWKQEENESMSPVATACKTVDEAIAAHKAGKIDDAEYKEVLAKLFGSGGGNGKRPKRVVKLNKSNGLYVFDESFKCWSDAKKKHYTGSFNMDINVAKALFKGAKGNPLIEEIAAFVAAQ